MKNDRTVAFIALAVFGILMPAMSAQPGWHAILNSAQHTAGISEWTQSQKPNPVPSPKPVPLPDPQPETRPAPEQPPPSGLPDEGHKENASQTFSGTILKTGRKYVLKATDRVTYDLDNQELARKYQGQRVEVTGILDESSKLIHVHEMKAAG